jgi:hypothetical protein
MENPPLPFRLNQSTSRDVNVEYLSLRHNRPMDSSDKLTVIDRFEIFEQLNRHQRYIDNDASLDSVHK